ncbi:hypothetical protein [Burkholderia pyrrocinia]|uniref:hypothetical protein n=1 Tax=Burkholderia pyrrocinia TaxID=60550 RepID=UPI001BD109D7|nr:hypothetical protein [Burkholderia pyrrocinia]QVN21772.1 hypothetical protein JYG32_20535 [Burkholderia pyrrocinia]
MVITEFNYFCADAILVAEKLKASVDDDQAENFVKKIFDEYKVSGSPSNRKKWLAERMAGEFLYMNTPPDWVGEPRWAYFNDEPMVFLHQFRVIDNNNQMQDRFAAGDTVFVFGLKAKINSEPSSWSPVYRTVVQTEDGENLCF